MPPGAPGWPVSSWREFIFPEGSSLELFIHHTAAEAGGHQTAFSGAQPGWRCGARRQPAGRDLASPWKERVGVCAAPLCVRAGSHVNRLHVLSRLLWSNTHCSSPLPNRERGAFRKAGCVPVCTGARLQQIWLDPAPCEEYCQATAAAGLPLGGPLPAGGGRLLSEFWVTPQRRG